MCRFRKTHKCHKKSDNLQMLYKYIFNQCIEGVMIETY